MLVGFLDASNEFDRKINQKNNLTYIIASWEYLGINLTKVKDLYNENLERN